MIEFNLERALAGEPVITRNGKKVTQLHLFNTNTEQPLLGIIEGDEDIFNWGTNGKYNSPKETSFDLFMAVEKKSIWINVYLIEGKFRIGSHHFPSKTTAKENIIYEHPFEYFKTVEITNESDL